MLGMKTKEKRTIIIYAIPPHEWCLKTCDTSPPPPSLQKVIGLKHVKAIVSPFLHPKLMTLALTLRKVETTLNSQHLPRIFPGITS